MIDGLTSKQNHTLTEILSRISDLEKAIVYGSRAKGNFKPGSDIDITLIGKHLTQKDLSSLIDQFYWSDLPYHIDVSLFKEIDNPDLIDHITRVGKVIYERLLVSA